MELKLTNISPLPSTVIEFLFDLTQLEKVNKLIIFGSRANADYETYSDIDLAVDAPLMTKKEWLDLKELAYYDVRTILQISMVHLNTNPKRLQEQILKTGKIIYVK